MRVDKWIHQRWPGLSYGQIQKALRKGAVRLEGDKVEGERRLGAGQHLWVSTRWLKEVPHAPPVSDLSPSWKKKIETWILYEDQHLIALNKPPHLASQGGSGQRIHMDNLIQAFRPTHKMRLVHRLDKETSGVFVVAKTLSCAQALTHAFSQRTVRKVYGAVVKGFLRGRGTFDQPLYRVGPRMEIAQEPHGLSALTHYREKGYDRDQAVTYVELFPKTGRMHQLRVHLASHGHPILGDPIYGRQEDEGPLALHCFSLHFTYHDQTYDLYAPAPLLWDEKYPLHSHAFSPH